MQWNAFCSEKCRYAEKSPHPRRSAQRKCESCGEPFKASNRKSRCCSKGCANSLRRGSRYKRGERLDRRLVVAKASGIDCCMIQGCSYDRTLDVHRVIPGREGGEYVAGNMVLLCPNHHAEITRRLGSLVRLDEWTFRMDYPKAGDGTGFETRRAKAL